MLLTCGITTIIGDEDFVVLACDGLWDTVDPETVTSLTYEYIKQGNDRFDCAKMLIKEAKSCGSMDNISVVVVFLDDHRKVAFHRSEENVEKEQTGSMHSESNHTEAKEQKDLAVGFVENEIITEQGEEAGCKNGENYLENKTM